MSSFAALFQVDQLSEPAGFFSQTDVIQGGTSHPSVSPPLSSNGYKFGYWTIDNVRQTGSDGRSLTQVSGVINAASAYKAYYFQENADSDSDGIMDWFEYRMFGNLSRVPEDDPDQDGFSNRREDELGQDPLVSDEVSWGGISSRTSPTFTFADTSMILATVKSDPAGFVTETSNYLELNASLSAADLNGQTNGYHFAYWSVNGVRQTGPTGVASSSVDLNVSSATQVVAHFILSTEDSDADGVMDWFELNQFGDLSLGPNDDPDGDGFSNRREEELGQEATIPDEVSWGGISSRTSPTFTFADTSMILATVGSDPAGFVTETNNFLESNATLSTANLNGETNGYHFAYWSVNGVRQDSVTGVASSSVALRVTQSSSVIAHYLPSSQDSDSDGVMDWFELYQFGNLGLGPEDDPDGDGFSNKREGELGQEATIADHVTWGGISSRTSTTLLFYQQVNRAPDSLELNGTIAFLNKYTNQAVGTFFSSDLDDPNGTGSYDLKLIDGNGSTYNHLFQLSGMALQTSKVLTTEGNFSIRVRISDDENASLEKVFHIQAIHDPNKDDDNDGLTYTQEQALGTSDSNSDTDGDGFTDGQEVANGSSPTDPNSTNSPPSALNLSKTSVLEKLPVGTYVGTFGASDPDQGNNITFSLVSGTGSDHNHLFSIDANDSLLTAVELDHEQNSTLSVRAKVQDQLGASLEAVFQIRVGKDFTQSSLNGIGIDFVNKDYRSSDFSGIRTESFADFSGAVLRYANFAGGNKKGTKFIGANLSHADFTGADIKGTNFTNAEVNGTNFFGAAFNDATSWPTGFDPQNAGAFGPGIDFRSIDLSGFSKIDGPLQNTNFAGTDLSGKRMEGADLNGSNLRSANLSGGNKKNIKFTYVDLSGANLTGSDIKGANFTNAEVNGTNFFGAAFNDATSWPTGFDPQTSQAFGPGIDFRNFDLSGFSKIDGPLQNTNFAGTDLSGKRLEGADLNGSSLRNANLSGGNKKNVKFTYVDLSGANLIGADISGATFTGAIYDTNTTWPAGFDPVSAGAILNHSPTDLNSTAPLSVAENQSVGAVVGGFTATDQDANATLTYTLVNGAAQNDNSLFTLDANGTLKTATVFDYESNASNYSIRVKVIDEHNASLEKALVISLINEIEDFDQDGIEDFYDLDDDNDGFSDAKEVTYGSDPRDENSTANAAPQITLATEFPDQIGQNGMFHIIHPENQTEIIRVTASDPDEDKLHFSIHGKHNLPLFEINATTGDLRFMNPPDFEAPGGNNEKGVYGVVIRVSDGKAHHDQPVWIRVQNQNEPPTELHTSQSLEILENQPAGSLVGNFHAIDPDANSTLTFSLVEGNQSDLNMAFVLDPNGSLRTAVSFDYESQSEEVNPLQILVRVSDEQNASLENKFSVLILDEYEPIETPPTEDQNESMDRNATQPPFFDGNYTEDNNGTLPPIIDDNQSLVEDNSTLPPTIEPEPEPESNPYVWIPIIQTEYPEILEDGSIRMSGRVLYDGGGNISEFGFLLSPTLRINRYSPDTPRIEANGTVDGFTLIIPESPYPNRLYLQAYAVNEAGIGVGQRRRLKIPEPPVEWWGDAIKTEGGWLQSPWFGAFKYYEQGWLYHSEIGWLFASPVEDGVWLWGSANQWIWTNDGVYPYYYRWNDAGWGIWQRSESGVIRTYNYTTGTYED